MSHKALANPSLPLYGTGGAPKQAPSAAGGLQREAAF